MRSLKNSKPVYITLALLLSIPLMAGESARKIMEKNDALPEAKTQKSHSIMAIFKGKKPEIKEFKMYSKKYGKKLRSRSRFIKPSRIEFLSWSKPGEDSLQWIKLSGGTVRKIAASNKSGSFVGSHFYYEDLTDRDIDDYDYKLLGETTEAGADCYKIESVKTVGTKVYEKGIMYVRKSDYFIIRVDLYEKKGHTKTMYAQKIEKINGILTPRKVIMKRTDGNGKTIIYLKKVEINKKVSDSLLKKDSL